jgi:hypothetical protein
MDKNNRIFNLINRSEDAAKVIKFYVLTKPCEGRGKAIIHFP